MAQGEFYTQIRNITANPLFIGFLGNRGATLAAGGDYLLFGHIFDWARLHGKTRMVDSLNKLALNGTIEITQVPAVLLYDPTTAHVKKLTLNNSTLGIADPSWGSYSGGS